MAPPVELLFSIAIILTFYMQLRKRVKNYYELPHYSANRNRLIHTGLVYCVA